jgi:hypothetical protein
MITDFRLPLLRVALGVLAVATIGCQRVALLAPAGSTITITPLTTTLPLNGTTSLIAHVIEPAGTPPQRGTLLSFTTSLGSIEPIEAETDSGGRVLVTFKAGALSGTATIIALSGGVTTGSTGAVKIAIGASAASTLAVSATPANLSGGGQSTIAALVTDSGGAPLPSVPVTFSTDFGSVSPAVVTTDANGVASTLLTTNRTAKVTATAGTSSTNGTTTTPAPTGSVTVSVEPLPTASISASANPQVNVPVTFTITANPGAGSTASIQNVTVNFGEGGDRSLGAASGTTTHQYVYSTPGSKTARVTVTDSNGARTPASTIVFVQTQAPIVSLTYTSSTPAPGTATFVNFTATVTPSNTSVAQYVWNFGDGQSTTTSNNTVSHTYVTATLPRTASVTITTTTNQTASNSTTVTQ